MSLDMEPVVAQDEPAQPEYLHTPRARQLLVGIGKVALSVGLMAGGALAAIEAAPPAHIEMSGANFSVQPEIGGKTIALHAPNMGTLTRTSTVHLAGKSVGAEITIDAGDISLTDEAGNFDSQKLIDLAQIFSDPKHDEKQLVEAAERHTLEWGAAGALAVLGAEAAGLALYARRKRRLAQETIAGQEAIKRYTRPHSIALRLATGAAAAGLIANGAYVYMHEAPAVHLHADPVFDGTPLEGAQLTGLIKPAVDYAVPEITNYIDTNDKFYDGVVKNTKAAFAQADIAPAGKDVVRILDMSDNHCNIGMDRVTGVLAKLFKVNFVVDTGDTTMSGSSIEEECVTEEAAQLEGLKIVAIKGNHDSTTTEAQERKAGMIVLDNEKIVKIDGLTIEGTADPRHTGFGVPSHLVHPAPGETIAEGIAAEGRALKEVACKEHPDIVLAHDPDAAIPIAQAGCANITLSGDTHKLSGPNLYVGQSGSVSYQFTEGTTGGSAKGEPTYGPLKNPGTLTVWEFDKTTGQPLGYYNIIAHPDTSVTISLFTPMPGAPISPETGVLQTVQHQVSPTTIPAPRQSLDSLALH